MRLSNPLDSLSAALYSAAFVDLPLVVYESVDFKAMASWTPQQRKEALEREATGGPGRPTHTVQRRPQADECAVKAMFGQLWGSTALGLGGLRGSAATLAYTVVIEGPRGDLAVYWHGQFGYLVPKEGPTDEQHQAFEEDLRQHQTVSRKEAARRYGAIVP